MSLSVELITIFVLSLFGLIIAVIALLKIIRMTSHYNSLTQGIEPKTLMKVLEGIQKTLAEHERGNMVIKNEIKKIESEIRTHIQTLTLKRFNPFSDTGGDQSFLLALLDGNNDGIVITSLHSRENTRFYVKSVKGGVGIDHPLSADEQKIIKR